MSGGPILADVVTLRNHAALTNWGNPVRRTRKGYVTIHRG